MRNIKLTFQYDGTKYQGWQRLRNTPNTIQEKMESILSLFTNENIELTCSGRTDAGVHAENAVANFKTNCTSSTEEIFHYCNTYMPKDIVVKKVDEVDENFHSRYNAKEKIYTYKICNNTFHNVFTRKYSYHIPTKLNIDKMREAASFLVGEHDFKSFTALKSKKKSTVRQIYSINIIEEDGNIDMVFHGNGFLYKMVRILAGTLIEVGLSNIESDSIPHLLFLKDRSQSGPTAPAHGLFLTRVVY
ncbi:tRNA pseudouridine(38-40) synthase TruA [Haloimpatiens lingqiaonensis]|uniref:tRNA pseudouridine(38-40) synthase TruA n=1 Tax=Haloimpatiens lingqiaonensis TaxID=1380675 RepID=UPI0010FE64DF|nr:tRNA pseudouridine(38-40) synthase TruA [Haloimpatiens lingqiaonensis]